MADRGAAGAEWRVRFSDCSVGAAQEAEGVKKGEKRVKHLLAASLSIIEEKGRKRKKKENKKNSLLLATTLQNAQDEM